MNNSNDGMDRRPEENAQEVELAEEGESLKCVLVDDEVGPIKVLIAQ